MKGPLEADDPELIKIVRKELIPPSTLPYNLTSHKADVSYKAYIKGAASFTFISSITKQLFDKHKHGFFIEAGALDGEYLSNTLRLEKENGWSGLLVEPDNDSFDMLKNKNRKAWLTTKCLGTKPYPYQTILSKFNPKSNKHSWLEKGGSRLIVSIKIISLFCFYLNCNYH